jgi:hypothetical protein
MTLYLNNSGDKWINGVFKNNKFIKNNEFILVFPDGTCKRRKYNYNYSFGNFAGISFRYKGKQFNYLPWEWNDRRLPKEYKCLDMNKKLIHVLLGEK